MRAALAVLCVLIAAEAARADDYAPLDGTRRDHVPEDVATSSEAFPRFVDVDAGSADVPLATRRVRADAFAGRLRAIAAEVPGTRLAAELLFSAAWVYRFAAPDPARFRTGMETALAAAQPEDPLHAMITLRLGAFELAQGNVPRAETLRESLSAWREVVVPVDMDPAALYEWRAFERTWRKEMPRFDAGVLQALGRTAGAARVLEEATVADEQSPPRHRARRFYDAAVLYARAGRPEDAGRAAALAVETSPDRTFRDEWSLWGLYAKHAMLNRLGIPGPNVAWAGPEFEAGAWAYLDGVDADATRSALGAYAVIGSHAHATDNDAFAVDVYLHALENPHFMAAAEKDPSLISNMTIGVLSAIKLGRHDEADRLLDLVERLGSVDPKLAKSLRAMIREGQAAAAAPPPPPEDTGEGDDGRAEGDDADTLPAVPGIGPRRDPAPRSPEFEDPEPTVTTRPAWTWVVAGLAAAALLVALFARIRATSRRD